MTDTYQRGQVVRILDCPLEQQHRGMEGVLVEANGRVLCVELDNGLRCWTAQVERVEQPEQAEGA
jgi:hypothetical protein